MVIISLFMEIKYASVYAIYLAIISGLRFIITSVSGGSAAGFGNLLTSEDQESINRVFDVFEFIQFALTTIIYTICAVMIIPFMQIYTEGIVDANYIQPVFAYLLIIAECGYCIRLIYSTLTNAAGHFKGTRAGAVMEAALNVVLSLVLVHKFGLVGIAIGTAVGMLSRVVFEVIYLSQNILRRPVVKFVKAVAINVSISAISVLICRALPQLTDFTPVDWIVRAIIVAMITIGVAIVFYLIFYISTIKNIVKTAMPFCKK